MDSIASPPWVIGKTTRQHLFSLLILSRLPQFGPGSYWALEKNLPDVSHLIKADYDLSKVPLRDEARNVLLEIQRRGDKHTIVQQAQREMDWLQDNGVVAISHRDERYPELLKTIAQAPPLLFVKGELNNLFLPQLAIVGSRHPSPAGRETALRFAQELSVMGFVITSGLALGIDAASHYGALKNKGPTIAVMGTGIDRIYPSRHEQLAQQIIENGGTLVTEFPLGTGPQANHFPRRNRIISGMSLGVLVVEAALKSGSLITARYALQHNREVFAIPGSIHNPVSRGCHSLLREGANLIESVNDLREHLQGLLQLKRQELTLNQSPLDGNSKSDAVDLNSDEKHILQQLGFDLTSLDQLQQRTGLEPGTLLSTLMTLELKGLVAQCGSGYQRLPTS